MDLFIIDNTGGREGEGGGREEGRRGEGGEGRRGRREGGRE